MEKMTKHYYEVMEKFHQMRQTEEGADLDVFKKVAQEMGFTLNIAQFSSKHLAFMNIPEQQVYDVEPLMEEMFKLLDLESEYPYWSVNFYEDGTFMSGSGNCY